MEVMEVGWAVAATEEVERAAAVRAVVRATAVRAEAMVEVEMVEVPQCV